MFSKELATCEDSLGLSPIWINRLMGVKCTREAYMYLLGCPSIERHGQLLKIYGGDTRRRMIESVLPPAFRNVDPLIVAEECM